MKGEFFLEIGTEEIPAGFIGPATGSLSDLFTRALKRPRGTANRDLRDAKTPGLVRQMAARRNPWK
jgi:glycyl-tRNA synthetase beta subunit